MSDVQWIQKSYFTIKVNSVQGGTEAELHILSEFCMDLGEAEQVSRPRKRWGTEKHRELLWPPGLLPIPETPPSASLSCKGAIFLFPGCVEASKGHCAAGFWRLESCRPLCLSARHTGKEHALSCHLELGHGLLVLCQENGSGWSPRACFQNLALLNKAKCSEIILTYY